MEQTENQALFSELTTEESETVNGASHRRRRHGYDSDYIYYYPRRSHYQEEYSRRHNYRHYRGTIAVSAVVRFY
ncbi:MAG TPA: hypothetical protein VK211_12885 [Kamptonema sp.]|nr:hypothetical protein [Kamptonema sp.]